MNDPWFQPKAGNGCPIQKRCYEKHHRHHADLDPVFM